MGIVLASLFFGLMHGMPIKILVTGLMGLGLHLTYRATRSIIIPMLIHFGNNATAMLIQFGRVNVIEPEAGQPMTGGMIWLAIGGVALFFTVAYAFYRSRVSLAPIDPQQPTWQPQYPSIMLPPSDVNAKLDHPPRDCSRGVWLRSAWRRLSAARSGRTGDENNGCSPFSSTGSRPSRRFSLLC